MFLLRGDLDEEIEYELDKSWPRPRSDWVLKNDKYYLVKYAENVGCWKGLTKHLTKRSRYARSGINSLGTLYDYDDNIFEIIHPDVDNRIYRGDKISQVTFWGLGNNKRGCEDWFRIRWNVLSTNRFC